MSHGIRDKILEGIKWKNWRNVNRVCKLVISILLKLISFFFFWQMNYDWLCNGLTSGKAGWGDREISVLSFWLFYYLKIILVICLLKDKCFYYFKTIKLQVHTWILHYQYVSLQNSDNVHWKKEYFQLLMLSSV